MSIFNQQGLPQHQPKMSTCFFAREVRPPKEKAVTTLNRHGVAFTQVYSSMACFSPPCLFSFAPRAMVHCFSSTSPSWFSKHSEKQVSHLVHELKLLVSSSFSSFSREVWGSEDVTTPTFIVYNLRNDAVLIVFD